MNARNNGAKPPTSPAEPVPTDRVDDTQPLESDDDAEDIIERIRAKRKREAAFEKAKESEAKRAKITEGITDVKLNEKGTVLIVIHNHGYWELRTDQFVCK